MKHTIILKYSNVEPEMMPLIRFDGPIAVPVKGSSVQYGQNQSAEVTAVEFIYQADEVRIVLSLNGEGIGESPYTSPRVRSI